MADKAFKTIDQQIELLSSRGLTIPDVEQAKDFLLRNNYYRISGYSLTLRHHDVFFRSATFQNIIDIYNFDHELRHVLLKFIEIIEVTIKSVYSHEFSRIYGPLGYLDPNNFTEFFEYSEIIEKAEKLKKSRLKNEAYLKHFDDLREEVPFWAYVDLFTLSGISQLYAVSQQELKDTVANILGFKGKRGADVLGSALHKITIIRNLCAHGARLFNRLFEQRPWLNKRDFSLLRQDKDGQADNAHLYGFLLLMRKLLKEDDFSELKTALIALTEKYPFVRMDYYGFRDDWKDVL